MNEWIFYHYATIRVTGWGSPVPFLNTYVSGKKSWTRYGIVLADKESVIYFNNMTKQGVWLYGNLKFGFLTIRLFQFTKEG